MKQLYIFFLLSYLYSSYLIEDGYDSKNTIFIYQFGKTLVNDNRELKIEKNGKLDLEIIGLPSQLLDSGIQINANNFKLNTFSIVRDLITEKDLLNHFVGNKIILKDYKNNIKIDATLISYKNNTAVYGTENGVIINPKLEPIFPFIPKDLKEEIYIEATGIGNIGTSILKLSYFTEKVNWEAEYHLILKDDDKATLSANYQVQNKTDKSFPPSEVFLIAGKDIAVTSPKNYRAMTKMTSVENIENSSNQPLSLDIDDVMIYKVPSKMSLEKKSNINSSFIAPTQLQMKKKYIALHSPVYFDRNRRNYSSNSLKSTDIFIELNSINKIKYHLPEGNLNIYQIKDGQKIFIGNKSFPKTSKGNQIYFYFKKSDDILHSFNQIEYEENNRGYKITIEAKFKNLKNKKSEIIWQEKPGKFAEILNSSVDFNKENIFEFNASISLDIGETKKETLTLFIPKRD